MDSQQQPAGPLGDGCTTCPLTGRSLADDFVPLSDVASLDLAVQDASAALAASEWQQGGIAPSAAAKYGQVPNEVPDTAAAPSKPETAANILVQGMAVPIGDQKDSAAALVSLPSWSADHRSLPVADPVGVNLTMHPGALVPLHAPQHQSWMVNPHANPNWRLSTMEQTDPVEPSDSVQTLIASCAHGHAHGHGSATTALDSVAAVAMDLIKMSNWRCMWKHCSGVVDHGDTVQQHILKHVASTVRKAQSCKMNSCTGRHLKPGQEHLSLHLADLGFNESSSIRCSWEGICTRRFQSADKYRRHIETHVYVDSSRYDCGWHQCDSHGFSSFHELLNHGLASHVHADESNKPLTSDKPAAEQAANCLWESCNFKGDAISSLQEHLVAAHGEWCSQLPERVVVCRWGSCRKFFTDKTKFAHHMCTHSGMRFYQCEMDECDHGFTSESQRRAHVRRHHEKSFKCETCLSQGLDKGYSSGFNLREHIRIVHEKKSLICDTCSRPYKSHKAWSAHQRNCQASAPLVDRRNAQLGAGQPY